MSDTTKEDRHTGLYVNLTLFTIQSIQPVAISLTIGASVQGYGEQCSEDLIRDTWQLQSISDHKNILQRLW